MKERIEEEVSSTENDVSRRKVRGERREGIDMREKEEESMSEGEKKNKKRIFGIAKGMFNMKDNFDEPLDEFKDYM